MAVAQFIMVVCSVVIFVFFTIVLCGTFGVWAWACIQDDIAGWKQYRLKDRVITILVTLRVTGDCSAIVPRV